MNSNSSPNFRLVWSTKGIAPKTPTFCTLYFNIRQSVHVESLTMRMYEWYYRYRNVFD